MKTILSFCFITTTVLSFALGKDFASPISYEITERKTDINLPDNFSKFTFTVNKTKLWEDGQSIRLIHSEKLKLGVNQTESYEFPDWTKNYSKTLKSGKYVFYFLVDGFQEVVTDTITLSSKESVRAEIYLQDTNFYQRAVYFKPVIYLYTEMTMEVSVKLDVQENLIFTYPHYENGWTIVADPQGKLKINDKIYNYLFWESEGAAYKTDLSSQNGFVVSSDTLLSFLENSLQQMNFTTAEAADFITFWYPKLKENEKNFIQFVFNEQCDSYAELKISPQPDHVFRVGMIYRKADSDFIPEKQKLESVNRNGFYVIEWGGSNNPLLFKINH